jgi:hypothetical protein
MKKTLLIAVIVMAPLIVRCSDEQVLTGNSVTIPSELVGEWRFGGGAGLT